LEVFGDVYVARRGHMAGKIFINYRRNDDAGFTQALYQRLETEFTADNLFMDVEGHIKPGDDFVDVLNAQVGVCDVMLVVIGTRWTELLREREGDPDDFAAIELKAALDQGKRVIPLLVAGANMPRADTLPESIRALARRNAVGLRPERFKADCHGLVTALKESLAAALQEREARTEAERKAVEAARLEAEAQSAARATAAEERGRAQAAAGLSADEIRKAEELASWEFVKDRNDIQDLRDHLARFPGGTTERYATAKLDGFVWVGLGSMASIDELRAYLDEFPNGASSVAAQERIGELEAAATEARAVEQRRAQERDAWSAVATNTDWAVIEAFLKEWPDGQYAGAAKARIIELRRTGGGLRRGILLGVGATSALAIVILVALYGYQLVSSVSNSAAKSVAASKLKEEEARQQAEKRLAQAEAEVRRKVEEEARQQAEKRLAQAEAEIRRKVEEEARQQAEKRLAEAESEVRRKADEEARHRRAEEETRHETEKRLTQAETELSRSLTNQQGESKTARCQRALYFHAMGLQQINSGNVSNARQFFERATDAGLCKSAVALAGTYDETQLSNFKVLGLEPNSETAQRWYTRAQALCAEGQSVCDCSAGRTACEEVDSDLAQFRATYISGDGLAYVIINDEKGDRIYRFGDESRVSAKKDTLRYTLYLCNVPRIFTTQNPEDKSALLKATVVKPADPRFAELDSKYLSSCDNPLIKSAAPKN
jgi:hypothetical protein